MSDTEKRTYCDRCQREVGKDHAWMGKCVGLPPSPEGQNSTEESSGLLVELSALAASLRREAARFEEGQLSSNDPRPLDRRLRAYADDVDEIGYKLCALDEEGWLSPSSPVDGTEVQWGWLDAGGGFVVARDEEQARYRTKHGINRTLANRVVGPAREVTE